MGLTSSPYWAANFNGWTIDIIHGDKEDPFNPFKWDSLLMNLLGQNNYNPKLPRVVKMSGGHLASELEAYVDDISVNGASEMNCHKATSRIAQITQYLG